VRKRKINKRKRGRPELTLQKAQDLFLVVAKKEGIRNAIVPCWHVLRRQTQKRVSCNENEDKTTTQEF